VRYRSASAAPSAKISAIEENTWRADQVGTESARQRFVAAVEHADIWFVHDASVSPDHKNWAGCVANNPFGVAAEDTARCPLEVMARNNNQIGTYFACHLRNFLCWVTNVEVAIAIRIERSYFIT
jgi:hypothetical protein